MASRILLVTLLSLLIRYTLGLTVTSGSPCFEICDGNNNSTSKDLVCTDNDFANTAHGETLQKCLSCLQTSTYSQNYGTDTFTFFYYLMLVQQTCLAEPEAVPVTYCSSKCDPLNDALSDPLDQTWFQNPYGFCTKNSSTYTKNAPHCGTCLQAQKGSVILGNFVVVGNIACESKPKIWDGKNISFAGDLFDPTVLNYSLAGTDTPVTATPTLKPTASSGSGLGTNTGTSQTFTFSSIATPTTTAQNSTNTSPVSRGAAAGIGVLASIIGVAIVIGVAFLARRRRKQGLKRRGCFPVQAPQPAPPAVPRPVEKPLPPVKPGRVSNMTATIMSPRTSTWFWTTNPKSSVDLSALPQRDWR